MNFFVCFCWFTSALLLYIHTHTHIYIYIFIFIFIFMYIFYITFQFFDGRFIWKGYVNFSFIEFIFVIVTYLLTYLLTYILSCIFPKKSWSIISKSLPLNCIIHYIINWSKVLEFYLTAFFNMTSWRVKFRNFLEDFPVHYAALFRNRTINNN